MKCWWNRQKSGEIRADNQCNDYFFCTGKRMSVRLSSDREQIQTGYFKPSVLCINLFVFKLEWDRRNELLTSSYSAQLRSSNWKHNFPAIMVPAVFQLRHVCVADIACEKKNKIVRPKARQGQDKHKMGRTAIVFQTINRISTHIISDTSAFNSALE